MTDNPEAQLSMARSATNGSSAGGKLLLSSVLDVEASRKDHFKSVFASKLLSMCLYENMGAKDIFLATSYEEHGEKISFLGKVCYSLLCSQRNGFDAKIQIGLLSLMSVWLYDHPKSVKEFLTEGSNVQSVSRRLHDLIPLVYSLWNKSISHRTWILLFKDCVHFCTELFTNSTIILKMSFQSMYFRGFLTHISRNNLHNLLQSRIGLDIFISRVQRLKETKAFNRNERVSLEESEYSFDPLYQEFIRSHLGERLHPVVVNLPRFNHQRSNIEMETVISCGFSCNC